MGSKDNWGSSYLPQCIDVSPQIVPPGLSPLGWWLFPKEISAVNPIGGWWFSIQERWGVSVFYSHLSIVIIVLCLFCHTFITLSLLVAMIVVYVWENESCRHNWARFKSLPSGQPTPLLYRARNVDFLCCIQFLELRSRKAENDCVVLINSACLFKEEEWYYLASNEILNGSCDCLAMYFAEKITSGSNNSCDL